MKHTKWEIKTCSDGTDVFQGHNSMIAFLLKCLHTHKVNHNTISYMHMLQHEGVLGASQTHCSCLVTVAKLLSENRHWEEGFGKQTACLHNRLHYRPASHFPLHLPSELISRERTRSLLFPTRMIGVWGWDSLRRRRSWAVRWKLRLSVTEKTRIHTSHCRVDRSWGMQTNTHTHVREHLKKKENLSEGDPITAE